MQHTELKQQGMVHIIGYKSSFLRAINDTN